LIIMQLKSAHSESALSDIGKIISHVDHKWGYKVRGHEIHQTTRNVERLSLRERANLVSNFCSKNNIEYLTYHIPVLRNEGRSLTDERSLERTNRAILTTISEADIVYKELGLRNKVTIVYHLPSVIGCNEIHYLNRELKYKILRNAESSFIEFFNTNSINFKSFCTMTVENVFPKYFVNGNGYATINMFHPLEMIRLKGYGIKVTLDLSHYQIYSNYISYGRGNHVGDLDRQIYGSIVPSWKDCIDLLGSSLIQLHINDGKGTDPLGEGLFPTEGEIPLQEILLYIIFGMGNHSADKTITPATSHETVQATIELRDGHLCNGESQRKAAEWLLASTGDVFR
jgi:hypothetical protein